LDAAWDGGAQAQVVSPTWLSNLFGLPTSSDLALGGLYYVGNPELARYVYVW